ncbi:MAG: pyridoxal-phosphate-dependent aminotransferase family protein [Thermomicrobiales bacterium]
MAVQSFRTVQLRIPGPTPLPDAVREATGRQMINHRSAEFARLLAESVTALQTILQTTHDVLLMSCSGSGGMEAAVANLCSPGDDVIAAHAGVFGGRFAAIAAAYGLTVHHVTAPEGQALDPARIGAAFVAHPRAKTLFVTHNESSTGVVHDLKAIAETAHHHGALVAADCITSTAALDVPLDAWGIDVAVSASQKAWMAPPGMAMVAVGPRAWQRTKTATLPRFYFDFAKHRDAQAQGQTPATPALPTLTGLHCALQMLVAEGLPAIVARHRAAAEACRADIGDLAEQGLRLFADPAHASNTVTAVALPDGMDATRLLARLEEEHGVIVAGGLGQQAGKLIRIGHLGHVTAADMDAVGTALRAVLRP